MGAPHCHVGRKIDPHCDCKDDVVDGRCGYQCENVTRTCSCPYHAYLKLGVVTCTDGLNAAASGAACVASWQNGLLVTFGVLIVVAVALLLYFVFGVLRAAGFMPCRPDKVAASEDQRIAGDGSDSEMRQ